MPERPEGGGRYLAAGFFRVQGFSVAVPLGINHDLDESISKRAETFGVRYLLVTFTALLCGIGNRSHADPVEFCLNLVGVEVFRKIVFLSTTLIERSTVGAQVGNIMGSEAVSEFFAGPEAPVILELPFVLIFLAVIAYLGGPVVFVPFIVLTLLCALGLFFMPKISEAQDRASKADRAASRLEYRLDKFRPVGPRARRSVDLIYVPL